MATLKFPPSTTISLSICVCLCIKPEGSFVVDGCLGMVHNRIFLLNVRYHGRTFEKGEVFESHRCTYSTDILLLCSGDERINLKRNNIQDKILDLCECACIYSCLFACLVHKCVWAVVDLVVVITIVAMLCF